MKCAVMKHLDIMIGIDVHTYWPPGEPAPVGEAPFITVMPMCGTFLTAEMAPTALTLSQFTMKRGTDIGPLIPHIGPPSLLTPLDILMSSSASYFGPSSVTVEGAPVAAALMCVINLNLNCNFCCPLPTGLVLCFTTHYVGMTLFDMLFGAITMGLAVGLDVATGFAAGAVTKQMQKHIVQPLGKRLSAKMASKTAANAVPTSAAPTPTAGQWQSATPTMPGATPTLPGAKPTAPIGGHRPPAATPTTPGWQSAKPSNPGAAPTTTPAGGHRPPAAKPTPWQSAKPSNPAAKPTIPIGNHRPPVKPPAKPAKPVKPPMTKNQQMFNDFLETFNGYALGTPFSFVNQLTLYLLTATGIEEFGGGEPSESEAKKQQADQQQADKQQADQQQADKKDAEEKS